MNKFIKNIAFFGLPLVLWAFFVILIDPFNYFNFSSLISKKIKEQNALEVNPLLYNAIDYRNDPCENVLIGDSRTEALPIDEIELICGETYKKLTIDGAKLNEIFDLIFLANGQKKLKHLVIGINFNMFNEFAYADRVTNIKSILKNPLRYIFNRNVAQVCFYVIRATFAGENIKSTPPMSREQYWKWYIETKAYYSYAKYKPSEKLHNDLLAMDSFAKANNIKLTFIIVPHNREFHNRLVEFGLSKEENNFKKIIANLNATVIDYDYENIITTNKDNFSDPVHYKNNVGHLIVNEVFKDSLIIGRKLK
jgi:hypothetical protein